MNGSIQMESLITVPDYSLPHILAAEKEYLLVYKPPRMHSAPLTKSPDYNLSDWLFREFPEIAEIAGMRIKMYQDIYSDNLLYLEIFSNRAFKHNAVRFLRQEYGIHLLATR